MKEQVKVLINSKKEAKQVKAILKGLGEELSLDFYDENQSMLMFIKNKWTVGGDPKGLKTISIRDLIILLTKPEESTLKIPVCEPINFYDGSKPYVIIGDLCSIKPEEEKVFLITSEDGVRLHVGDDFYCAQILHNGTWELLYAKLTFGEQAKTRSSCVNQPDDYKAFSTKEAAEKWILERNNPKYKSVQLYHGMEARIYPKNSEVAIMDGDHHVHTMTFDDIHDIRSIINQD